MSVNENIPHKISLVDLGIGFCNLKVETPQIVLPYSPYTLSFNLLLRVIFSKKTTKENFEDFVKCKNANNQLNHVDI